MTPTEWAVVVSALISGGALYKTIESVLVTLINKGKSVREELREEIARLETKIKAQEDKIEKLQEEIERQQKENDTYRERNIQLMGQVQRMEITLEAKDLTIKSLEDRIKRLQQAVRCSNSERCPLLECEEPSNG